MGWYCKFSGWWGPIENTLLSAFPVVQSGHVMDPDESRKTEKEVDVGAKDDRFENALPTAAKEATAGVAPNGISGVGKKSKADMMSERMIKLCSISFAETLESI